LPDGYISELLSRFDDDGIDMVKQYWKQLQNHLIAMN
jgi:hypothetical protein